MKLHYFQIRQLYLMLNAINRLKIRFRIMLVVQAARKMQQTRQAQREVEIISSGIRKPRMKR